MIINFPLLPLDKFRLIKWYIQKTKAINKELKTMAIIAPKTVELIIHQVVNIFQIKNEIYE
jgi:hypothetical protein